MLRVYSIFKSIQGESTRQGLPCAFVRLAGCPFHCVYCDTRPACESKGRHMRVDNIVREVEAFHVSLAEVTGGEPLAQPDCPALLSALADVIPQVMLETSGGLSIERVDPRVRIIMDVKCPDSYMSDFFFLGNIQLISSFEHEIKFVISSRCDFDWAIAFCAERRLFGHELLFSPVVGKVSLVEFAEWVLASSFNIRMQLQIHSNIWPNAKVER